MPNSNLAKRAVLAVLLALAVTSPATAENTLSHKALFAPNTTYPYFEKTVLPAEAVDGEFDVKAARFLAEASLLAYVTEPAFIKTRLAKAGFSNAIFFDRNGAFAFLAIREDALLLTFRGTEPADRIDYLTDVKIVQKKFLDYGTAHQGFIEALDWISEDIDAAITTLLAENPRPAWVTGHSLGGALATLYSIRQHKVVTSVYTMGTPRLGGIKFAKNVEGLVNLYRLINDNDIIPRLPTPPFYAHIGSTYFMSSKGELLKDPPFTKKWDSHTKGHVDLIETLYKKHWLEGHFNAVPTDYIVDHSPRLYAEALAKIDKD